MSEYSPLRVGVVGLGAWGREHVRAWSSLFGADLVAVCDSSPARTASVAAEFHVDHVFTDAAEMASAAIHLDAVSIATHEATHKDVALPFIESGISLLVEKPLALSVEEASELVQEAAHAGVILMPGHILRFDSRLCELHARIADGELGTLRSISARRLAPRARHAKVARTHPAIVTTIHDLDLLRWFFSAEPETVRAWSRQSTADAGPDLLWSVVEFEGGQLGFVETGWVLPDRAGLWLESEIEVIGTEGIARIRFPGDVFSLYLETGHERPDTSVLAGRTSNSTGVLRDELAYFAHCVATRSVPLRIEPCEGIESLRLALAVAVADTTGREVDLRQARSPR
jgi:UDP-N-acetylglucosamine 3-dehydrogenase